jgi:DnaJ-domain-containing protein 1
MSRFEPDAAQVRARRKAEGCSLQEAKDAVLRESLHAAVETFRHEGDRDLLADVLLELIRKRP